MSELDRRLARTRCRLDKAEATRRRKSFPGLVPLRDHDNARFVAYINGDRPHPNGIACPSCGKELWDTNPQETVRDAPPQIAIHCPACNYQGTRIA